MTFLPVCSLTSELAQVEQGEAAFDEQYEAANELDKFNIESERLDMKRRRWKLEVELEELKVLVQ